MSVLEHKWISAHPVDQGKLVDIDAYMSDLIASLKCIFGSRLLYVGLQGSYLRGEATENSDLDVMAVIDQINVADLDSYRAAIQSLPHYDKSCGFICGKSDLLNWNPLEICHLVHCTKNFYGVLAPLVPAYTEQDIRNFVKMGVNNLYHEICHRYIHADAAHNTAALPGTYKAVFFILQNLHYLNSGEFIATKLGLLARLRGNDRGVLQRSLELSDGGHYDFADSYHLLFTWCQDVMKTV